MSADDRGGFPEGLEAKLRDAVNGWMREAHPQAFATEAELRDFVAGVAVTLLGVAAKFTQAVPTPSRVDGHTFKKAAERAFKEAVQPPG